MVEHDRHQLVPEHRKLSDKEKQELFSKHNIDFFQLPKIMITDAALKGLQVKLQDVICISRKSPITGVVHYYRGVVDE